MTIPHMLTVFRDWEGNWTVRSGAAVDVYSTRSRIAAEAYAVEHARRWPPCQVRILRADGSLERVWRESAHQRDGQIPGVRQRTVREDACEGALPIAPS